MRYRSFLIGLIVASLALASSSSDAKKYYKRWTPQEAIPGGPLIVKLPDLVVYGLNSTLQPINCFGKNAGTVPVVVTIQNQGFSPAINDPAKAANPLFYTWSVISTGSWNPAQVTAVSWKEISSGSFKSFLVNVSVMALVAADKSSSSIGIGAKVNPNYVINESNYDNNFLIKQFTYKGVFCP
jgi:hypothetical protein